MIYWDIGGFQNLSGLLIQKLRITLILFIIRKITGEQVDNFHAL